MPVLKKALEQIGLGQKEVQVLLVLLEHGPMLASAIAKLAKLNRTTTYGLLRELGGRGLVSQVKKEGAARYQSIAPELLPQYIERRRDELGASKKEVEDALPQIKLLRAKGKSLPKVQFFEGKEGVEQAYEDTLENNKGKKIYEITGIESIYTKLDPKFIEYYPAKRARLGIKSFYIAPESEVAHKAKLDDTKYLREVSFIPEKYKMDTEIAMYDNKVGIYSFAKENPVAIIIEDDTIAHTMKTLFEYIESTTKK